MVGRSSGVDLGPGGLAVLGCNLLFFRMLFEQSQGVFVIHLSFLLIYPLRKKKMLLPDVVCAVPSRAT
jgi:hypothetical protein